MDIYKIQNNYQSEFLVIINENDVKNTHVSVYEFEKCKFDQPFLCFQTKNIFVGNSMICTMTEFSGAIDNPNFDGNTILLECVDSKYV